MDMLTIFFIAFGLSMDAFAISVASGVIIKKQKIRNAVTFGVMFGGFQMLMPVIGYGTGCAFHQYITAFDHWVAFGLLFAIGIKMIYEAVHLEAVERSVVDMNAFVLLGLSIATSIDALAAGISFSFLNLNILPPVLVIGAVTFIMSFFGVILGNKFGGLFEKKIEILGGLVLIGIGIKILLSHLI